MEPASIQQYMYNNWAKTYFFLSVKPSRMAIWSQFLFFLWQTKKCTLYWSKIYFVIVKPSRMATQPKYSLVFWQTKILVNSPTVCWNIHMYAKLIKNPFSNCWLKLTIIFLQAISMPNDAKWPPHPCWWMAKHAGTGAPERGPKRKCCRFRWGEVCSPNRRLHRRIKRQNWAWCAQAQILPAGTLF